MRGLLDVLGLAGPKQFEGSAVPVPGKAIYQSPSGKKVTFDFEDLSSSYDLKAGTFETAEGNGTYVQPAGHSSGRFPMAAIFYGPGYGDRAEAFKSAILESGRGVLTHPQHRNPITVVPVGTLDQFDAFASGTNQTVFAVLFHETTELRIGTAGNIQQSYDDLLDASSVDFSGSIQLDDVVDETTFINRATAVVKAVKTGLQRASSGVEGASRATDQIGESVLRGMDVLIGQPLTMAKQIQLMVGAPARTSDLAASKLQAYGNLAFEIFGAPAAERSKYSSESINNFHLNSLVAKSSVGSAAKLAEVAEFETRSEYLYQIEALEALLDAYREWSDANFAAIAGTLIETDTTDQGGGASELLEVVSLAIEAMLDKSANAKVQMSQELESERTPLDLCFELYGSAKFEVLDRFYADNDFSGDEYFLIPKGRRVVWRV